jgi:hypothetical protein
VPEAKKIKLVAASNAAAAGCRKGGQDTGISCQSNFGAIWSCSLRSSGALAEGPRGIGSLNQSTAGEASTIKTESRKVTSKNLVMLVRILNIGESELSLEIFVKLPSDHFHLENFLVVHARNLEGQHHWTSRSDTVLWKGGRNVSDEKFI